MRLLIREIHPAGASGALNDEWFIVENGGDRPFSTAGCTIAVSKGKGRPRSVGTLDPGFTLQPEERVRVVTGNPSKKAHGAVPEGEPKSYHLFLVEPLLIGPGTVLTLSLKQHEIARAAFDPAAKAGVAAEKEPSS